MPALLCVAATCCLSSVSSPASFLFSHSVFHVGFLRAKEGWLKGMDPGGCNYTWEAFDSRGQGQEQLWAVHLKPVISWHSSFPSVPEPALWVFAEEVQEQQWLAETVGRLHQLLLVLLQDTPGGQV